MKLIEKIILGLFLLMFGVLIFSNWVGKIGLFGVITWLLALTYLIGGFWLFNSKVNRKFFIPIIAGIAFAIALISLPFLIRTNKKEIFDFFPIANILLFIGLGTYLILKRKSRVFIKRYKHIFFRSTFILIISTFFTYVPITFKPYRLVMKTLNKGNEPLVNNILVFDYIESFEESLDKGDCEKAIDYAKKANNSGKIWLGINTNEKIENIDELWKISGTYSALYRAYKCKANQESVNEQYENALNNYKTAHEYLIACDHNSKFWEEEKSWSLNNIAYCYMKLNQNSIADSIYLKAIENYKLTKDTADNGLAKLISNLAFSFSEQAEFVHSGHLYNTAINILLKDTLNKENRGDLLSNYNKLAYSYIQQDSSKKALFYIQQAIKYTDGKKDENYCKAILYKGICNLKLNKFQEAESLLKACVQCYENQPKIIKQNIAECKLLLCELSILNGKFDEAREYINYGIEVTEKNFGSNSSRYANYLESLASLNKSVGDYNTAEKQYNRVINLYINNLGDRNYKLPAVFSKLADLEVTLSKFNSAKQHSDSSISIATNFINLTSPRITHLLNTNAYIEYSIGMYTSASSEYQNVIKINSMYDLNNMATTANALNGLGLIEIAKKNFQKADTLLEQSLRLHQTIFSDNNPFTAIIYLNIGNLYIQKGKLEEAEDKINKAFQINKRFFNDDHDIFADCFVFLGDIAKKKKQNDISKNYYKKALEIYLKKFDDNHWKVISTRKKYS